MVSRRLLTEEFVNSASPPASGELWVADTLVRGFGLRLWSTPNSSGCAFAIRVTNAEGRSVRRTYNPNNERLNNPFFSWMSRDLPIDENGQVVLSALLGFARDWARIEIGRLKGRLPTEGELRQAESEYQAMRSRNCEYIKKKTLGELCEIVLDERNRISRGWTEEYADRLRHAFDQFDNQATIRESTLGELSDGRLTEIIETSTLSSGNLRNLKSLLNVVLWNVHEMGGPPIGRVFPKRRDGLRTHPLSSALDDFSLDDFQKIISGARELSLDWRSSTCIELCFYFWAPVTRVMTGRWSQIIENRWYPYSISERSNWQYRWSRIDAPAFACLRRAAESAEREGRRSDYFFPSPVLQDKPITNIDRAWNSLLSDLGFPMFSLKQCSTRYRKRFPMLTWPDLTAGRQIAAKLSKMSHDMRLSH